MTGPATPSVLETAELTRRLRETEAELARTTARLLRLESSTAVQAAQVLISAARDPKQAARTLPREALRLGRQWRSRGSRRAPMPLDRTSPAATSGPGTRTGTPQRGGTPQVDGLGERLLAGTGVVVVARDRPLVAGILAQDGLPVWASATHLTLLGPDDAVAVLDRARPDVLVVDAGAAVVGPWAHLGTFAAPERERTLLAVLRAARETGCATLLWTAAGGAGDWEELRGLFDSVVEDDDPAAALAAATTAAATTAAAVGAGSAASRTTPGTSA